MSKTLLHDWECSIEKNKNNTEELLKIAEDIYNTAYARGKASTERPQGEWKMDSIGAYCSNCHTHPDYTTNFCACCGADMRGDNHDG